MSYEGYSQFICVNKHSWDVDCNSTAMSLEENICPICNSHAVWENMVNITNGSFEDGQRIDGFVDLKISEQKSCDKCNSVLETKYEVPKKRGGGL